MEAYETSTENKVKILLDEANLAFCETAERKDAKDDRRLDGSAWDLGRMDGEFDEEDFHRILEMALATAKICDENPELEEKTASLFQSVTADNAGDILGQVMADERIRELARLAVITFLLRFPSVQSYVNKGHPLVLAMDEYMLENANAQNWQDYKNIAEEFGWL